MIMMTIITIIIIIIIIIISSSMIIIGRGLGRLRRRSLALAADKRGQH